MFSAHDDRASCGTRCLHALQYVILSQPGLLPCREKSGYYRASLQLQAFLQIVVGEHRMAKAKQLVVDRHAEP